MLNWMLPIFLVIVSAIFPTQAQAKIVGTKYVSDLPPFSIQVPICQIGTKMQELTKSPEQHETSIQNDFGDLFRILVCRVKDFDLPLEEYVDMFSTMFKTAMMPGLKSAVSGAKILSEETLVLENQLPALFIMVDFPNGSLLQDVDTGLKFDSKRGFLCFRQKDDFVTLSYQSDLLFKPNSVGSSHMTPEAKDDRYIQELLAAANSYQALPERKNIRGKKK